MSTVGIEMKCRSGAQHFAGAPACRLRSGGDYLLLPADGSTEGSRGEQLMVVGHNQSGPSEPPGCRSPG